MTWVDLALLAVLAVSALLAFSRGFVREVLGVFAWVGAILVAIWAYPWVEPRMTGWLGASDIVPPATYGATYLATLIVLLLVSGWVGGLVRRSAIGGVDRTLGLLFGLARGAALVIFAYVVMGWLVPIDRWPAPVLRARALPLVYEGAQWVVAALPDSIRPAKLAVPPPPDHAATADAFLQLNPIGRATARPLPRP